jgi:hypothetical protein
MHKIFIAALLATVAIAPAYAKDKDGDKRRGNEHSLEQAVGHIEDLQGRLDQDLTAKQRDKIEDRIEAIIEKYDIEVPPPPPPPPPDPEPITSINSTNFHACIGLTTCTIGSVTIKANNGTLDVANSDGFEGLGVQGAQGDSLIEGQSLEFVRVDFAAPKMINEITVNHLFGYSNTLEFKSDGNRNGPTDANGIASTLYTNYAEVGGAPPIHSGFSLNAKITLLDAHAGLWQITDPWDAPVNYIELHPATTSATGGVSLSSISFDPAPDSFVGF